MTIEFTGDIWFWKGPAPWYFVRIPPTQSGELKDVMTMVTYGWGMIPVEAQVGKTKWTTALWPKDGMYILPVKTVVRKAEKLEEGDVVKVTMRVIEPDSAPTQVIARPGPAWDWDDDDRS